MLFRARTLAGAQRMLSGMIGLDGVTFPDAVLTRLGAVAIDADLGVVADMPRAPSW